MFSDPPHRVDNPLFTYSLAVRAAQREFDIQFDIIHSFGAAPLAALRGVFSRMLSDAKAIHTIKALPPNTDGFGPRSLRYARVLNYADGVTAATPTIKRLLEQHGCRQPIDVIPQNIDTAKFSPVDANDLRAELGYESDRIVLYYGHFKRSKGVAILLRSIKNLVITEPDVQCLLAWSRGGEREPYDALITELGIEDHVDIIPWEPGFPINRYVNLADVVALPYRSIVETEAIPLCVVESMAARQPVVSTVQPHLEDFFTHEEDIYLVPPTDPDALADGLRTILDAERLRQRLSDNAFQRSKEFAVEEITDEYLKSYRRS